MNIFNLIGSADSSNPISQEQIANTGRRELFRQLGDFGKKLAVGAIPLGTATLATGQKAMAANEEVVDILNFALLLEYLDSTFYTLGLEAGVIPEAGFQREIFRQISKNENNQVKFLQGTIRSLGGMPIEKPQFDYTAKGRFTPFENYGEFLALSQAFEDTGVRAYKGQAPNLIGYDAILTAALRIHSVEARHAARIRRLRAQQSWIPLEESGGLPPEAMLVYKGEGNVVQGGIDLTTITSVDKVYISEAFDEPLSRAEVTAIAALFLP